MLSIPRMLHGACSSTEVKATAGEQGVHSPASENSRENDSRLVSRPIVSVLISPDIAQDSTLLWQSEAVDARLISRCTDSLLGSVLTSVCLVGVRWGESTFKFAER